MNKGLPHTLSLGQAGVYRACSELLLRGVNCSIPVVDTGVDILLHDGRRVQVKATKLAARRSKDKQAPSLGPAYRFTLSVKQHGNFDQGSWRRTATSRPFVLRSYSDEVDFLVLWGVDEDRFWIVPAAVCDQRQCLVLYPGRRVPQARKSADVGALASVVHPYEGRWDLLGPSVEEEAPMRLVGEA